MSDCREALEVDRARVSRRAAHNELRTFALGKALELVVINSFGIRVKAVRHKTVQAPREVHRRAVCQMAAMVEAHAKHRVPRLEKRCVRSHVGIGAAMGLHVGKTAAEQGARTLAREVLDHVDFLASAVVPAPRIALGILIGEDAAHSLHNCRRYEVLGCNKLDRRALARKLSANCCRDLWITLRQYRHSASHRTLRTGYLSSHERRVPAAHNPPMQTSGNLGQ